MTAPLAPPVGDRVSVSTYVDVAPSVAFEVFTEQIDQWWRRGPAYRANGAWPSKLVIEPRLGGHIYEQFGSDRDGAPPRRAIGTITAWEPPARLAMTWRAANFVDDQITNVEVWFTPSGDGTRVRLEHSGWSGIPADHPARHGKPVDVFARDLAQWWGSLATAYRRRVSGVESL